MITKELNTSYQSGVDDVIKHLADTCAIDVTVAGRIDKLNREERHYKEYKRGNSWTYCHQAYVKAGTKDPDYLALQLAFYLASWGMYRGSSFLLELDYKIHIPAVEMMMEDQYRDLFAVDNPFAHPEMAQKYKALMFGNQGIYTRLEEYYLQAHKDIAWQRKEYAKKHPSQTPKKARHDPVQESDTLLTKILLGVYGCVPAYDRYFKDGIGFFGKQKLLKADGKAICGGEKALCTLLADGRLKQELDEYWQKHKDEYTFMKVVDMYFFSLGTLLEDGVEKAELEGCIRQRYSIK